MGVSSSPKTGVSINIAALLSANFRKLLPLASSYNARVVAANRRGYPGSAPVSADDMAFLERAAQAPEDDPVILTELRGFWRARARELFEYLVALVNNQAIPATSGDDAGTKGGIVLVGWSFGSVWMTAFLAHLDEFTRKDAQLRKYLRRVVIYGKRQLHMDSRQWRLTTH